MSDLWLPSREPSLIWTSGESPTHSSSPIITRKSLEVVFGAPSVHILPTLFARVDHSVVTLGTGVLHAAAIACAFRRPQSDSNWSKLTTSSPSGVEIMYSTCLIFPLKSVRTMIPSFSNSCNCCTSTFLLAGGITLLRWPRRTGPSSMVARIATFHLPRIRRSAASADATILDRSAQGSSAALCASWIKPDLLAPFVLNALPTIRRPFRTESIATDGESA